MLLRLQRSAPSGAAIRSKLYIDGTYFCDTLERVGVQIPALWYTVAVTMSPRFKRLLPIVERWHTTEVQAERLKGGEAKLAKPVKPAKLVFYKNCTWGFFILLLLTIGRIALRIAKAIYQQR